MPWKNAEAKQQRWRFIEEWSRRKSSLGELCRRWEISRKTAYKWLERFEERGRSGLGDRSRAAHTVHNRPDECWLQRVKRWRRGNPSWGAPKLHQVLARRFGSEGLPSEAAISRWLQHWGMSRKRRGRATARGPVVRRSKLTLAQAPNEVWSADFKGQDRTGDGRRVEPLTVRDMFSRLVLSVDLRVRPNVEDTRRAFGRLFRQYGLPRVIRTDNGRPFGSTGALGLTRLSAWWVKLGIRVEFITPGRPEQNGAHEQMHRIYKAETLQPAARSWHAQQQRSERWRRRYNEERPHEGLGMRVPAEVYRRSRRKLPLRLRAWKYPSTWCSRLVKGKGMIALEGRGRYVGEAFERERVGLKRVRAGVWAVYFGPLHIGELWDRDHGGIRAVRYHGRTRRKS